MLDNNLHFFISYSHEDKRIKTKLIKALKPLSHDYNINEIWYDGEILAGDNIDKEVLNKLNTCNIIILLISNNFLTSEYCMNKELKKAIQRMNKGECQVIPVVVSRCEIPENLPFSKLKTLPYDRHPICDRKYFHNQDEGCAAVVKDIRQTLNEKFPNSKKKTANKVLKESLYIELYKNGVLKHIPVSQKIISDIPKYNTNIHKFRTIMDQALVKAKQNFAKEYKRYKNKNLCMPNEIKLDCLRYFLMDICSYTKKYITDDVGIKVHFRVSKNENYLGLIASTSNNEQEDLSSDWSILMTPIPKYKGLIYHSSLLHAPLIKSLNPKLNYKGKNDIIWKDYVTFTFNKFYNGQTPMISYCISVHKDYYTIKGDVLKILAYLNFGDIIEHFLSAYCNICVQIDKNYNIEEIINTL